ncbi:hypothetical protein GCM10020295_22330 [Streptomyces cinereospinus]
MIPFFYSLVNRRDLSARCRVDTEMGDGVSVVPVRLPCMERVGGVIDSRETLVSAVRAGARLRYLHFWGTGRGRTGGSARAV